jgi:DNA-binding transcriptional MerR regulator
MSKPLSIGEVARLAGRRPSSIRYYEQIGLLPGRDDAGTNRSPPGRRLS